MARQAAGRGFGRRRKDSVPPAKRRSSRPPARKRVSCALAQNPAAGRGRCLHTLSDERSLRVLSASASSCRPSACSATCQVTSCYLRAAAVRQW
jgi:hypothetical protein